MPEPTPDQLRDAVAAAGRYVKEYRESASQLNTYAIGGRWYRTGVPAAEAARWANLGYLPEEALAEIAQGMTVEMAQAGNEAEFAAADGGREEQAMRVIDGLVTDGTLIDPRYVTMSPDPDDPDTIHVTVHDEPQR